MKSGRLLFCIVILLGVLAGALAFCFFRDGLGTVGATQGIPPALSYDTHTSLWNAVIRRRYPDDAAILLEQNGDFFLDRFKSHPDRPWYLWQWWKDYAYKNYNYSPFYQQELPLSQKPPEQRKWAAHFAESLKTLREHDPDNGYPLLLQAWLETQSGMITVVLDGDTRQTRRAEVVDPEHAAKAADLVHQAVRKNRFTMYGREMGGEWLGILGTPETLAESFVAFAQTARMPIPNLTILHDTANRLMGEARRRANMENQAAATADTDATAFDILHDLQTLGARVAVGEPHILTLSVGRSIAYSATEDGAAILNEAGQHEAAERLLARGRAILRPALLIDLMDELTDPEEIERLKKRHGFSGLEALPLYSDPTLMAEAKRLLALRRENMRGKNDIKFNIQRSGSLLGMIFPNVNRSVPWTEPLFSEAELKTSAQFELWGVQKFLSTYLLTLTWLAFLVLLLFYCVHFLLFRKKSSPLRPSLREIAAMAVLFGCVAAIPPLIATFAGNFLWELTKRHMVWQFFWNIWGVFAACWVLAYWIRGRSGSAPRSRVNEFLRWLTLAGLLVAIPTAYLVYSGVWLEEFPDFRPRGGQNPIVVVPYILPLLPMLVWGLFAFVRWARILLNRSPNGPSLTPGLRFFLAGLAGGMVVWLASYWVCDWQERKWAARDTLLAPRLSAVAFNPAESRIIAVQREHIENVLASEAEGK